MFHKQTFVNFKYDFRKYRYKYISLRSVPMDYASGMMLELGFSLNEILKSALLLCKFKVISSDNSLLLAFSSMWVGTLHSTATELQIQALGLLESAWTFL